MGNVLRFPRKDEMNMVNRIDIRGDGSWNHSPTGAWVSSRDYDALAAELAQARERATSLADLVQRMAKECNGELGCRAYQHYASETKVEHEIGGAGHPCPCKGHPFHCFNHPHDCGCQSKTETVPDLQCGQDSLAVPRLVAGLGGWYADADDLRAWLALKSGTAPTVEDGGQAEAGHSPSTSVGDQSNTGEKP